ncbi:Gfo/Idh/MocA family protein [Haladaptatus sp. DYSN1]|uniref:Gfo/Idh/MocA family protein n=1 Tax=unclassified Haladaptatus TaxID=2622732 RepID=UPI0024074F90|nr:Gfo/Idh/MocA family oxidoreductase [Haladaptatus sp. DYSN1]
MIAIGIVGRGLMARTHALRYARLPNAAVVGVAARGRPTDFATEVTDGATAYPDAETMFADADLDAVDICTPTDTHRELVEAAVDHGLAIRCEKPLARTLTDSRAIVDAVTAADVPFCPGHVVRFFPEYETAKRRIEDGVIGTVGNVRAFRESPFAALGSWYQNRARSGGALFDLALHDFDFLRWVCGDVERVFARRSVVGNEEYALTTLRFADGTVGHVDSRWSDREDGELLTRFEFSGTDGHIDYDSTESNPIEVKRGEVPPLSDPVEMPLATDPYTRQLEHFLACVEGDATPRVTAADALESVTVGLAALDSVERGEPVYVDEFDGIAGGTS